MDIVVWLRTLGLGKYEAVFRENDIDETVLPSLTHENLKELGVASLGHRVKLLDAIAALRSDASGKAPSVDATASSAPSVPPEDRAERRQVTVMFSDLVGSTALSARMDPEDLREVISAYQKCVAETVGRFGGFVAKYMGDGVLVYFGYPQAHEDDAERAVRAGLELVGAVGSLKTRVVLLTRVGIATGLVVVGDLIGSGASQEQAVVGETPNLAARLQGIAEPNSVVIAEGTRKLLGNLFELEDLGAKDLKGIAGPVRVWAALRASSAEGRFEALHGSGLTDLVGREEELELLLRRWSKAKGGQGQVVLLSGEAGIGKSRLTAALLERLATEPHTLLRYFCSTQHTDSALYPVIGQMERAAGFVHDDSVQARLDKFDALLTQTSTPAQDAALFAEMLSLPNDGRYPSFDELTAEQRRQKTLEALTSQMETLARENPVLMIFEDAHWTDPTSLEVFDRVVDRIQNLRVLLIVTFRPEFEPPWIGRAHVTDLTINPLARNEVDAIIDRVVANKHLAVNIRQEIADRTDGIPLFIEEMTKAVLEAESESTVQQRAAAIPSPAPTIPATLHASLMARLDRLGRAKEIAQIGSAIGREFSHALLAAVAGLPEAELLSALDRLIVAGLLFREAPSHASYLFKHTLVQDVAYATLLKSRRRQLHSSIAKALAERFPVTAERQPEVVAHHFTEAALASEAIGYWLKAGQRATERSADQEAVRHLERGLALLRTLPETEDRDRLELDFHVKLSTPLVAVRGYTSPEVGASCERATILSDKLNDVERLFVSLFGQFTYCNTTGKTAKALEFAQRCQMLGTCKGDRSMRLVGHRAVAAVFMQRAEFTLAREQFERVLALHDPERDRSLAVRFMHDPIASSLAYLAIIEWISGYPERAADMQVRALTCATELNHVNTTGFVHYYAGWLEQLRGNVPALLDHARMLAALAKEHRVLAWRNYGMVLEGWAVSSTRPKDGISLMQQGLAELGLLKTTLHVPYLSSLLAQVYGRVGDFELASAGCIAAREKAKGSEQYIWEAELHRIEGEMIRHSLGQPLTDVEDCFGRALDVSRRQGARMFELRAAMSMARLWRDQGKPQQARELLAPVCEWFTEGFDTRDLKEAKTLLDTLAA